MEQSFTYVLTAAYFAAPAVPVRGVRSGQSEKGLDQAEDAAIAEG